MTQIKQDKIVISLKKKGFKEFHSSKHDYYHFYYNGLETEIRTHVSRGSSHGELGDSLLNVMAKQIKLKKDEFVEFVQCYIDEDKYISILKKNGLLSE